MIEQFVVEKNQKAMCTFKVVCPQYSQKMSTLDLKYHELILLNKEAIQRSLGCLIGALCVL